MISEETDKGYDLSANNVIPQGQNILRAFSCADSYGFVDGNCMPMLQDTYRQAILQTQVAVWLAIYLPYRGAVSTYQREQQEESEYKQLMDSLKQPV